jgi:hypothetical protein
MGGSKEIMVVGGEGSSGRMICRAAEVEHWVAQGRLLKSIRQEAVVGWIFSSRGEVLR